MIFIPASDEHQKAERKKARELRKTSWWKNLIAIGRCYHCQEVFPKHNLTMDHLTPIVRGGRTTKANVVVSCKKCNSEKGYRSPLDEAFDTLRKDD